MGVQISIKKPSGSLKYATVCPHGLIFGFSTIVAPTLIAVLTVSSTSSVVKPISIPKGLFVKLLSVNPAFKFDFANDVDASGVEPEGG